ncbi:MAG: sulfatase-like hydrolase/transferase [Myxococcota bacterium]
MSRPPLRPAPLVFATLLPIAAAILFLPAEFAETRRALELGRGDTALRGLVLVALLSKSLFALVLGLAPLMLGARRLAPRTLRALSLALAVGLLGLLAVDLEVLRVTGQHAVAYWPYLLDPGTFVWAGQGFDVVPALRRVAVALALALGPAWGLAWLVERRLERASTRLGRRVLAGLIAFALVGSVVAPLLPLQGASAGLLQRLHERMPWTGLAGLTASSAALGPAEEQARAVLAHLQPGLVASARKATRLHPGPPVRTPDLLVVVVESLRADALDAVTMPRLWAFAQQGLRLDAHSATSNASHYGLFALLYGRSPLFYFDTLEAGVRPTLPAQLAAWGYERHHLGCSDVAWRGMDRFFGAADFAVERLRGDSLPDCDRSVVLRAAALLAERPRAPRFVLAFLTSTHFGYHHPPGAAPFQPELPEPNALELDPDRDREGLVHRYRNSAHSVDGLIGALLDRVDPRTTLVVVTGDHGEALFDDGTIAHASRLSDAQTRVPFVLVGPEVPPARVGRGPSDHADLLPTLLARMGIARDALRVHPGRDLLDDAPPPFVPLVAARARRGGEDLVVLASAGPRPAWRIDPEGGRLRFLGHFERDGTPADAPVSAAEGEQAVRWLDAYLESLVGR